MPSIQEELAALRSRKLTSKEASKLKDAAPMSTPEAVEATLQDHKVNLKHVDTIAPATSAPTGTATIDREGNFYVQQAAKKREDQKKKLEAAQLLRSYVAPVAGAMATALPTKTNDVNKVEEENAVPELKAIRIQTEVPPGVDDTPTVPIVSPLSQGGPSVDVDQPIVAEDITMSDDAPLELDEIQDVPDLDLVSTGNDPASTLSRTSDLFHPNTSANVPLLESHAEQQQQNRNEKKSRKIMQKLGLRPVHGIFRVTFTVKSNKADDGGMFVIAKPDVYTANSTTYVIFGQANRERKSPTPNGTAPSNENFQMPIFKNDSLATTTTTTKKDSFASGDQTVVKTNSSLEGNAVVDETGLSGEDINLVVTQTGCSRIMAVNALRENDGDLINAIMSLHDIGSR